MSRTTFAAALFVALSAATLAVAAEPARGAAGPVEASAVPSISVYHSPT